ncbi:polysaccharide pyruvyl transferase family protein [Vibrio natriegens]|uniref:polysaccharide pyruvyl transferase family protein n=1 Tax=Vibrio natriegens TaxID=691 RepID=UPI0008042AEC|nr:polysaccharide pyruvyl transferase family protein [Vibrio natriegens]ANQ15900.1 hypothetical protein BA891_01085 [Vibrio natriegens]
MSSTTGILTIHSVYNYGAMLQAYALAKFIENQGHKVEIIDYQPYNIYKAYNFYFCDIFKRPRGAASLLKQKLLYKQKFKRFTSFVDRKIPLSNIKYSDASNLKNTNYNTIISGSDQIWNPYITGRDKAFLLDFTDDCQKIAYSSSFGVSSIDEEWSSVVSGNLSKFSSIGVREKSGKDIINNILPEKDVELVLDPVFLLDPSHWRKLANQDLTPNFEYVLVYSLETNNEVVEHAKALAKQHNLKIVTIHPFKNDYQFADVCINDAGPAEFVDLIDKASYIVTNSFHGTAFSILLNKRFSCILHSKTGTRMTNLFSIFDINPNNYNYGNIQIPIYQSCNKMFDTLRLYNDKARRILLLGS